MNEEFKYLPKPDKEVTREIERCDEVRKNGGVVRFRFENDINEGEDTGVEYVNVKNDEKSINCLNNTKGACVNGGNARKIMGNTLGTGFSRMQCSIKKRRLKDEIILNNRGGIFRSLYDSSRKLIKMHEFSREVCKGKFKGHLDRGQLSMNRVDGNMDVRYV
ncbi:hypothetical protein F8M41_019509 [Gigaspora margarita]|uniref:Uncharacterized protein n=1 Tax=Gigaspora margarita TaxID=4874 RepID=A0A8H4AJT3_GIGMA|nr:hypothetical protein F8M41_019509 [Gigaspora margarita]